MSKNFSQRFSRSLAGNILNLIVLILIAVFMAMPMLYTVTSSLKPMDELFLFPPSFFVKKPTLNNFLSLATVFRDSWVPMSRYLFNSVFVTLLGTIGHVIISSLAAFRISKYNFPGKKILFEIVVLALMFSGAVTSIPNYIIMTKLGMIDTQWSIIIPAFAAPLGLFLMKQFIDMMIPDALLEAARIDGAKEITIFHKIVLPIIKPAWLTLIIFSFQGLWNSTGQTFIFSEELKTLPYALNTIVSSGLSRAGVAAAIAFIMILPPITVFILSQSNILETMATSGMKD